MWYGLYSTGELPVLSINGVGYAGDIAGATFGPRKRDVFLICYVLSGKGVFNGHPLGENQGFIVTPGMTEYIYAEKDDPWELLWFISMDKSMWQLIKYYKADEKTSIFNHTSPAELQEIKKVLIAMADKSRIISDAQALEFFFSVFKYHMNSGISSSSNVSAAQMYVDFSVNYIKTNYDQNITVSKLTKILGISQPYLYKIYKNAFGKSPKAFITDYCINQAKRILSETDMSIADTARSVGFSDSFAFSKCFSSKQGCSPTEYRNMCKKLEKKL